MTLKLEHPSTIQVSGPTGCGKTKLVVKLIDEKMLEPMPQRLIWIYSEWQPLYEELIQQHPHIEFYRGMNQGIYDSISSKTTNLLILDDQMSKMGNSTELSDMFTEGSHHRSLTIIFIVQNLYSQGKAQQDCRQNLHYSIIFKNPRDMSQIKLFGRRMYPDIKDGLIKPFREATSNPYGSLLIDGRPETPEAFRVRSIFDDYPDVWPAQPPFDYIKGEI